MKKRQFNKELEKAFEHATIVAPASESIAEQYRVLGATFSALAYLGLWWFVPQASQHWIVLASAILYLTGVIVIAIHEYVQIRRR